MRILISGAGGFVGGHVAAALAAADHDVVALVHRRWADALDARVRVRIERVDLARAESFPPGPFHAAIHCAAAIPATVSDDATLFHVNVETARRIFDHAAASGASKIIYCSSMSVYGRIDANTVDPDTPIQDPGTYGRSKLEGERLLERLCRANSRVAGLSLRLPGVVGVGSHHNFLSDTMGRLCAGEVVTARNPEAFFNNVVHVRDLAAFMIDLLSSLPTGHRSAPIAAEEPLRIRQVMSILEAATRRRDSIRYVEGGKPFLISNEAATRLGYRPATVFDSVTTFASEVAAVT
jgi:UDP-glucose 4-epimerase